jgi:hypothetical protein
MKAFSTSLIVSRDVNGDNKTDIIILVPLIYVYFNLGHSIFDDPLIYPTKFSDGCPDIADVNDDGKLDINVANTYENRIEIYFNTGNNTFHNRELLRNITQPRHATAFDIKGDGKSEIVILNNSNIRILSNHC